jgi:hypothetical protein
MNPTFKFVELFLTELDWIRCGSHQTPVSGQWLDEKLSQMLFVRLLAKEI